MYTKMYIPPDINEPWNIPKTDCYTQYHLPCRNTNTYIPPFDHNPLIKSLYHIYHYFIGKIPVCFKSFGDLYRLPHIKGFGQNTHAFVSVAWEGGNSCGWLSRLVRQKIIDTSHMWELTWPPRVGVSNAKWPSDEPDRLKQHNYVSTMTSWHCHSIQILPLCLPWCR